MGKNFWSQVDAEESWQASTDEEGDIKIVQKDFIAGDASTVIFGEQELEAMFAAYIAAKEANNSCSPPS